MNTASKTRHVFILFLADIVWGIAFVAQSKGGCSWSIFIQRHPLPYWCALPSAGHKNTG